jgi:hypothetical protein
MHDFLQNVSEHLVGLLALSIEWGKTFAIQQVPNRVWTSIVFMLNWVQTRFTSLEFSKVEDFIINMD